MSEGAVGQAYAPQHRAADGRAAGRRRGPQSWSTRFWLAFTALLLLGGLLWAGSFGLGVVLNSTSRQWVRCEVYSSSVVPEVNSSSLVPTKGRNTPHVNLSTGCGTLSVYEGGWVTAADAARLADRFKPHTAYEFKLGWLPRHRGFWNPYQLETVWDWRAA